MKVFFTRNHVDRRLQPMAEPWLYEVGTEIKSKTKDEFAEWLNKRTTNHRTLTFCVGDDDMHKVTAGNQCRLIYGFFADYDGAFSEDSIEAARAEMREPSLRPSWWVLTHSRHLRLVWEFEAPVAVSGNTAAEAFLSRFASEIEASKWGAKYDIASERPTQLFDIGNEWHEFEPGAQVPQDLLDQWAYETAARSWKFEMKGRAAIPFEEAVAMLREVYPEGLPPRISVGTRWNRFWDPASDNMTGIVFFEGGVYNFISGKDKPVITWDDERLLGRRRCERYMVERTSPIVRQCAFDAETGRYWRLRADLSRGGMAFTPRSKGDFADDLENLGLNASKPKGGGNSEVAQVMFRIREEREVNAVAPVLYREPGILRLPDSNKIVLNVSNVHVLPVPKNAETGRSESFPMAVTADDRAQFPWAAERYLENPSECMWDNPFVTRFFPHIHRFITTLFLPTERDRKSWVAKGYALPDVESPDTDELHVRMATCYHQITMLISWLSTFYRQGESRRVTANPGQALVLAGPASAGKSFLAKKIIAKLAGGYASGVDYFLNSVRFTDDMVCSPFIVLDDAIADLRGHDRERMTNLVKQVVATGMLKSEAKFKSALSALPWAGRVGIFCNSDAQSLAVLPTLEQSTKDKFMMLLAGSATYPFSPDYTVQDMWLLEELPWFALFLLGYRIPQRLQSVRYGVRAWQHPDMVRAAKVTGFSNTLAQILAKVLASDANPGDPNEGSAIAFSGRLIDLWSKIRTDPSGVGTAVKDTARLYYGLKTLEQQGAGVAYSPDTDVWTVTKEFVKARVQE